MHIKQLISLTLLVGVLGASENSSLLSKLKQEKLDIDRQTIELESDNLKYDWIKQIMGSYSTSSTDGKRGGDNNADTFAVTLDQPVFKSGGIYFAIQYAGANREFLRLSTTLNEQNLIKNVISAWLSMNKYDLQIQRQKYLISNAKIDIIRKKEQYESGFLDSSFLDQAILTKTTFEKNLIDMESQRYSQLMIFKSLSDSNYMDITPPTFMMVDQEKYITNSLALKQQMAQSKRSEYLKKMTMSNYLPTFSVYAGYYDSPTSTNVNDTYNQVGLKVSMPLIDVNRGRTIEIRQLEYLKSKIELQDKELEEGNIYQDSVKKIELLNKKIDIVTNDAKLYESLLVSTKELFEAGEKTIYDVNNLENSKQTMVLDKKIYEIDAQKVLLELYAKMNGEI
jgi:outer membrane protein TolC